MRKSVWGPFLSIGLLLGLLSFAPAGCATDGGAESLKPANPSAEVEVRPAIAE